MRANKPGKNGRKIAGTAPLGGAAPVWLSYQTALGREGLPGPDFTGLFAEIRNFQRTERPLPAGHQHDQQHEQYDHA
jgi:hypothetical protein